uniref:Vomeronasal 2, receptor 124 n=1 Tax=Mus musculus TaxID=10090 RepID=A0A338P6A4_MOUSE
MMFSWIFILWLLQISKFVSAFILNISRCYYIITEEFHHEGDVVIGAFFPLHTYYTGKKMPHPTVPYLYLDNYIQYGITLRTTSIFSPCYLPLKRLIGTPIFYPTYLLDLISTMSDSLKRRLLIMLLFGSQLLCRESFYLITIAKREISLLHSQEQHGKHLPKLGHCFNSLNFHRLLSGLMIPS